ncbi:MAG: ferric iron uptake transcriptional regulator [Sulfobacillus sp.]
MDPHRFVFPERRTFSYSSRMSDSTGLKRAGLKATLPRLKILAILEDAKVRHMGAEDIYKALQDLGEEVGLATYRVLTQFEAAGLVIRRNFEGGRSVFEINQGGHHDHIVCVECGKVFEFYDPAIDERQRRVAEKAGFTVDSHSLYMYGVCWVSSSDPRRNWIVRELPSRKRAWLSRFLMNTSKRSAAMSQSAPCISPADCNGCAWTSGDKKKARSLDLIRHSGLYWTS